MFLFYSSVVLWGDFRGFRSFRKFSEKTLRQGQIKNKKKLNVIILFSVFSNKTTQMSTEDEGLCTKVVYLNFISYHWPKSPNSCSSKIFGKCARTNGNAIWRYFASTRMTWLCFITPYLFHKYIPLLNLLTFYRNQC